MTKQTGDLVSIIGIFALYALSYTWLIEPKPKRKVVERTRQDAMMIEYLDDPEDEIRFTPEIFDTNDE